MTFCIIIKMNSVFLVVFLLLASWSLSALADQKEISLNGDKWLLSDEGGRMKQIQATVPGIVHMDLL